MHRYFVKDKDNILTHNHWSGGEYDKNNQSDIFLSSATVVISNEHSSNGEYSYKITPIQDSGYFNINLYNLLNVSGKTARLTLDYLLLTNSSTSRVNIIQLNSNNAEITRTGVQLSSNDTFDHVSLTSLQLDANCVTIVIRVLLDATLFLDNLNFKIQ